MDELIGSLLAEIKKINKLQSKFLDDAYAGLSIADKKSFRLYLEYCLDQNIEIDFLAKAYDLIVKDTLREQIYFKKNKKYRYSTYAEVASSVYMNDAYMSSYMYGLAITSFLWPNHVKMRGYFENYLPKNSNGIYFEVGPGHGMYFMKAMSLSKYSLFEGIDISPTSVNMTNSILGSGKFGNMVNYKVSIMDFILMPEDKLYDAVVMGEVLEHVEQPHFFLKKIKRISKENSFIYITTCINAPAIDHISLFSSVQHLETIILESGLSVKDKLVVPYANYSLSDSEKLVLPINIALVLEHNGKTGY